MSKAGNDEAESNRSGVEVENFKGTFEQDQLLLTTETPPMEPSNLKQLQG